MAGDAGYWDEVYATKAGDDVSWYEAEPSTSLAMIDALNLDPRAGAVDIGGGASPLAAALLERGWSNLSVLDISAKALEANRRALASRAEDVEWVVADVATWRPPRRYGLWHDRAVLHFLVDTQDQEAYVEALRSTLELGGGVVIGCFAPDGPTSCSGLPVVRRDAESLALLLGPDFALVEERREVHATPWGAEQHFCWASLRHGEQG